MPSEINTSDIDTEFPVPGQDNDSQGFRDNFTNIKDNLDTAKTEIETLQTDTVKVNADTTFLETSAGNPTQLVNANLRNFSTFKFPVAAEDEIKTATSLTLSFNQTTENAGGDYQVYQFTQSTVNILFETAGWPSAGRVGKITLELTTANGGTTVTFGSGPLIRFDSALHSDDGTLEITSSSDPVFLEIWTRDGGNTLYVRTLGEFKSVVLP
jgi:hypothetical protein